MTVCPWLIGVISVTAPIVLVTCATAPAVQTWHELAPPPRADEALRIARYVMDSAPGWASIAHTRITYVAADCAGSAGQAGMSTSNGCVGGATGSSTAAAIAWTDGSRFSDSALAHEAVHMWECWRFGVPDLRHAGERWQTGGMAWGKIAEIIAALKAVGL